MQVEGQVKRYTVGSSRKNNSTYTMIQVGDTFLKNIIVPDTLAVFLEEAHGDERPATLHITGGKVLAGISMPNGKEYAYKPTLKGTGLLLFLLGIPLIPVLLLGLFLMHMGVREMQLEGMAKNLTKQGFIPV